MFLNEWQHVKNRSDFLRRKIFWKWRTRFLK